MTKPLVQVPAGVVEATHQHTMYGPCVISRYGEAVCLIRTSNGTAFVPTSTLSKIKED